MKARKYILPIVLICCCLYLCYFFRYQLLNFYYQFQNESTQEGIIDFAYWKSRNPDVYAWIRIEGTNIDYPILQSADDTEDGYYLTHDIDRESNIYGAIYTEKINSKDFTNPNTVIYGHNMIDDSMFGSLGEYINEDYFSNHNTIVIYTPNEKREYEIVAAYEYPETHILSAFDFTTEEGTNQYIQQIPEFVSNTGGILKADAERKAPLLTLSTCTPNDVGMRFLVQGVLTEVEVMK